MKVVFDTSILIDGIRNVVPATILIEKVAKKEIRLKETLELIFLFTKVEVDNKILQKAAEECRLWTKNKKDFKRIKEIDAEEPY